MKDLSVLLGAFTVLTGGLTQQCRAASVQEVMEAWERRQSRIASGRFELTEDRVFTPLMEKGEAVRQEQLEGLKSILVFEGMKFRYETFGLSAHGSPRERVSAFDGILNQSYYDIGRSPYGSGVVQERTGFHDFSVIHIRALTLACRPLHPELFGPGSPALRMEDGVVQVGEHACVVLSKVTGRLSSARGGIRNAVYVDPARDFIPLRYTGVVDGQLSSKVDIEYAVDDQVKWMPTSWNAAMFARDGVSIIEGSRGRVKSYTLNEKIKPDEFTIAYAPGTHIFDKRHDEREFVVMSDGSLRPFVPGQEQGWSYRWVIASVMTMALLLAAALYTYRRNQRK